MGRGPNGGIVLNFTASRAFSVPLEPEDAWDLAAAIMRHLCPPSIGGDPMKAAATAQLAALNDDTDAGRESFFCQLIVAGLDGVEQYRS